MPKKLTITVDGNADTRVYNGVEQRFYGTFTAACSEPEFDVNKFHYLGSTTVSGKDTGDYEVNPKEAMCIYDEEYAITWIMGNPIKLTITPAEITIHVTGHTNTVTYNGSEQRVEGYDLICEEGFYERALVSFTGEAVAKGTAASEEKYMMGLAESLFGYSDTNVKAAFVIEDGWLKIDPAPDPGPGPDPSPDPSPEPGPDPDPPHPAAWTIIYNLNGGTYNGSFDEIIETYPDGAVISIHEAPSREGYTFLYWMGSEYQPGDRYTVTENHTFTAVWQNNRNHRGDSDLPDTRDNFRADRWILMMGISTLMSLISLRMLRLYR